MTAGPCSWCAWDCPSPEVALCAPVPEPPEGHTAAPTVAPGHTQRKWMTDVIRDISDYAPPQEDEDGQRARPEAGRQLGDVSPAAQRAGHPRRRP